MASQQSWDPFQILDLVLPTVFHGSFIWCVPAQLPSPGCLEVLPVLFYHRLFPLLGYPLLLLLLPALQPQPGQLLQSPDYASALISSWKDFPWLPKLAVSRIAVKNPGFSCKRHLPILVQSVSNFLMGIISEEWEHHFGFTIRLSSTAFGLESFY